MRRCEHVNVLNKNNLFLNEFCTYSVLLLKKVFFLNVVCEYYCFGNYKT